MIPNKQYEKNRWLEQNDEENQYWDEDPTSEPLDPEELEIRREQQKYKSAKHDDGRDF